MRQATIDFQFVTPAFLGGANQQAELRMPSVRGALRWWSRAMEYPVEDVFGTVSKQAPKNSTQAPAQASSVVLRDLSSYPLKTETASVEKITGDKYDYFLWPFSKNARQFLPANTRCKFQITTRRQAELDERVLKTFLLLGSLGARSRRAYGSIWPINVEIDGKQWKIPTTIEEFRQELQKNVSLRSYCVILQISEPQKTAEKAIQQCEKFLKTFRCGSKRSGTPSKWGKNDHDVIFSPEKQEVFRPILGLPLVQTYSSSHRKLTTSIPNTDTDIDRLASPLHFKIIPLREGKVPILTVFTIFPSGIIEEDMKINICENGKLFASPELSFELIDLITDEETLHYYWPYSKNLGEFPVEK